MQCNAHDDSFTEHFAHPALRYSNHIYNWLVAARHPIVALTYPKELRVPPDYADPRFLTINAHASAALMAEEPDAVANKTLATAYVLNTLLIRYQVPTFFVGGDLLAALAASDPPDDFLVSELKWPAKAMLLMLPSEMSKQATGGCEVVYISIARVQETFDAKMPFTVILPSGLRVPSKTVELQKVFPDGTFLLNAVVIDRDGTPAEYHAIMPLSNDTKLSEWWDYKMNFFMFANMSRNECPFDAVQDKQIADRLKQIAIQVLLAFNTAPELLKRETVLKAARKDNHGKITRRALWEPNFIGRDYVLPREKGTGESHASPHAHFRRGHFRNQRYGPRSGPEQHRLTWIQPVFVGV
jgi:hypothetical protein